MTREIPERYELCERTLGWPWPIDHRKTPQVVGAPFNSEEEAVEWGKKYGYVGENYYVRKILNGI